MRSSYTGKTVVDGTVRYLSVSSLEKADPRSGGCYRRYWYRYVDGKVEEENLSGKASKDKGIKLHNEAAHYLLTGEMSGSPLLLRGAHFMPPPKTEMWIEHGFHTVTDGVISSPLTAGGIPVIGYIDCAHKHGINYGADDEDLKDPPGTVEVIDWKWKGTAKDRHGNSTLKRPDELVRTIQMSGYGELIRRITPEATHVRLSHGYFPERGGSPQKVTRLHVVDDCAKAWEYTETVARTIVDIAKETNADLVPANKMACESYGGCPMRAFCSGYRATSLDGLFSKIATDFQETVDMSLLSTLPPPKNIREQLEQEEKMLRAAQPEQQMSLGHTLAAAWARIEKHGRGTPALSGAAAKAYASATGVNANNFAGTGQLAAITLQEVVHINQLADELDAQPPQPAMAVTAANNLVPTNTPASIPVLASASAASDDAMYTHGETPAPSPKKKNRKSAPEATATEPSLAPASTYAIFVDCVPDETSAVSLHPYVDKINAELARRYCVDSQGRPTVQDVRCAPKDSPLAFGAWKGALHEIVRTNPPAPGSYLVDTRGSELSEIVADALRIVVSNHGGVYVRGLR